MCNIDCIDDSSAVAHFSFDNLYECEFIDFILHKIKESENVINVLFNFLSSGIEDIVSL